VTAWNTGTHRFWTPIVSFKKEPTKKDVSKSVTTGRTVLICRSTKRGSKDLSTGCDESPGPFLKSLSRRMDCEKKKRTQNQECSAMRGRKTSLSALIRLKQRVEAEARKKENQGLFFRVRKHLRSVYTDLPKKKNWLENRHRLGQKTLRRRETPDLLLRALAIKKPWGNHGTEVSPRAIRHGRPKPSAGT